MKGWIEIHSKRKEKRVYILKSGWIKEFVVRVRVGKGIQHLSLSWEETMQLQLMCCTLTNPSLSQFQMEIEGNYHNR
jgi:hypothetical protein